MSQHTFYGNVYYGLLALLIICFASYTMLNMIGQLRSKEWTSPFNWMVGGSLVYSLGLWAMHIVSLLGSDYLVMIDWSMLYAFIGCTVFSYMGIIQLSGKWTLLVNLALSSLYITIGFVLLHYLTIMSGSVVENQINVYVLLFAMSIGYIGIYGSLYWFMTKQPMHKLIASLTLGITSMAMHLLGMKSMIVEYSEILTTDRLNHYLLLLAFLLGIATLLIFSFTFTTWLVARKYSMIDARYKLLVENSLDTIALIRDDKWDYVNHSGLRMFEAMDRQELINQPIYNFLHEKHHDQVRAWLSEETEYNQPTQKPIELEWITLSGASLHTEIVRTTTRFSGQLIDQVIIRDISERKKNEELYIHSEKLYVAGQLAAGIAHEIRNPLTSLKGFLQLISSGRTTNSNYYDIMKSELIRIESIVSELLMLSKPQMYELSHEDCRIIMSETVTLLEPQAIMNNIQIDLQMEPQPLWIYGVEDQVKQVFINIINNAIEVMPGGGMITVSMSLDNDKMVEIRIKDEGPGITNEQLAKIGQPFYTTKDHGTGIGLMVTFKIVDNHHGSINACSEMGQGTTFIIRFPYKKVDAAIAVKQHSS